MSSSSFLVATLGSSMYSIMSSVNGDSFTSYFPTYIPFIYFSFLIAVANTSNTVLHKTAVSRHPCLGPDLRENAFSFSVLSIF